ncbi:ankyrin repeat domain-containing protein, partial [Legionella maceachernii]
MQSKNDGSVTPSKDYPLKPTAYSNYFAVHLDEDDYGKSPAKHNAICNQQLLVHLEELSAEGIELCEIVSNAELINAIKKNPQESPDERLTWHHCHSKTTFGNQQGLMHLVPRGQHEEKNFGEVFHVSKKGGYHEWAVPNGAPERKRKGYPPKVSENDIKTLPVDKLGPAILVAVGTNDHKKLNLVLARARELKLSEEALTALVTQNYSVGFRNRQENLLHLATAHGNLSLINPLLTYFTKLPNFSRLVDSKGNTAAHIAAGRNRKEALEKLAELDIDLSIRNKKRQTAYDLAQAKHSTACITILSIKLSASSHKDEKAVSHHDTGSSSSTDQENRADTENKRERGVIDGRDPYFVYGDRASPRPKLSGSTSIEGRANSVSTVTPHKSFRELINYKPTTKSAETQNSSKEVTPPAPRKTFRELINYKPVPKPSEAQQSEKEKTDTPRKTYRELINYKPTPKDPQNTPTETTARRKTFRELMNLPPITSQDAPKITAVQPRKTFRELMNLPNSITPQEPSKETAAQRRKTFRELMNLPNSITPQEPSKETAVQPRKTFKELINYKPSKPTETEQSSASQFSAKKAVRPEGKNKAVKQQEEAQNSLTGRPKSNEKKTFKDSYIKILSKTSPESSKGKSKPDQSNQHVHVEQQQQIIRVRHAQQQRPQPAQNRQQEQKETQQQTQRQDRQRVLQQIQQRAAQQRILQQAQQRANQQVQERLQQQPLYRAQQQAQQRLEQQKQQRVEQQAQPRNQNQTQQHAQKSEHQVAHIQHQVQQRAEQQRILQQAQQRAAQQIQHRLQQQPLYRAQQQAQQRLQQQGQQQRQQQQALQRNQNQLQQRLQQQAQQRVQQQAQQRSQQQVQQRLQQQAQQRAQQQAQQRAQQHAQQRAQ